MPINLHKRLGELKMANNNKSKNMKGKVYSVNPLSLLIEKTINKNKNENENEKEELTQEQKDLVNSFTVELDKIIYKDVEKNIEEENAEEENDENENKNIEEEKNVGMEIVENKNILEELPKGLNLNDLENIKMIAKFMNKLTLHEQRKNNFPKAIKLLIALHESDRIIENKNKLCNVKLIYAKESKEEVEESLRNILNIKKAKI
uniref:Uncharacterized protein n=1 Tax=Meloidogyne hapla TaxID=6305 RepID=A0A1I8B8Z4_MELHA